MKEADRKTSWSLLKKGYKVTMSQSNISTKTSEMKSPSHCQEQNVPGEKGLCKGPGVENQLEDLGNDQESSGARKVS
jgi:hypothetical protein